MVEETRVITGDKKTKFDEIPCDICGGEMSMLYNKMRVCPGCKTQVKQFRAGRRIILASKQ